MRHKYIVQIKMKNEKHMKKERQIKLLRQIISLILVVAFVFTNLSLEAYANILIKDDKTNNLAYETEFRITSQWPGSFNGEITIKNTDNNPIENWALEFQMEHQITNIWNADIVEQTGKTYIIKNKGWNATINPGQKISIGFTANWTDIIKEPTGIRNCSIKKELKNNEFSAAFRITNDWGTGFNGEIKITNNSDKPIEYWTLEFDFDRTIQNFWDARS